MRTIFTSAMDQLTGHWWAWKSNSTQAFPKRCFVLYDRPASISKGKAGALARYPQSGSPGGSPHIILAVATDPEGLPLHVSILRGNGNDTQTLRGCASLRRRFGSPKRPSSLMAA